MSQVISQKSQEYRTFTVEKRGKDKDVRVPQFSKKLTGDNLKRAIGRMAWNAANEDRDKAVALAESWLKADFQLMVKIHDTNLVSRDCVDGYIATTRAPIKGAVTNPSPSRIDGIQRVSARNLMDYPLRRGVRLGDATKELLIEEIKDHEAKGKTMLIHAAWCKLVLKNISDDKTKVRDVLKESDLERFLKTAQKAVA